MEERASNRQDHVKSAVAFCFERAVYGVLGEENVEGVGVAGRRKINVEAGSGSMLLSSSKDGVGMLGMEMRTEKEKRRKWEGPVVLKTDSDLRRSMAARLVSLEKPRCRSWRG